MAYRDDLEAALAHAEAAERDLAGARAEVSHDHERIAELEKQLAAAHKRLGEAKRKQPDPENKRGKAVGVMLLIGIAAAITAGLALFGNQSKLGRMTASTPTVDVTATFAEALAKAKKVIPDPLLLRLEADYVDPNGITDLEKYGGEVRYRFLSPTLSQPRPQPPSTDPIGAPSKPVVQPTCGVSVVYRKQVTRTYEYTDPAGTPMPGPPACKVTEVWAEAIKRGAPANALAHLRLDTRGKNGPRWEFAISDHGTTVFETKIPDSCPNLGP